MMPFAPSDELRATPNSACETPSKRFLIELPPIGHRLRGRRDLSDIAPARTYAATPWRPPFVGTRKLQYCSMQEKLAAINTMKARPRERVRWQKNNTTYRSAPAGLLGGFANAAGMATWSTFREDKWVGGGGFGGGAHAAGSS
jgi:hypothetical protein